MTRLPPYQDNDGQIFDGGFLPPFTMTGVSIRMLPVTANIFRLRQLCDQWLNSTEYTGNRNRFVPFAPYVLVMVIDYGKMTIEKNNLGWSRQQEIDFVIPVEWYRQGDAGSWSFVDWAMATPFVFVDDPLSLATGRQIYGWPKVEAWLEPALSSWTRDVRNPERLMSLETMLFPKVYAGERQQPRSLLDIYSDPAPAAFEWPFRFESGGIWGDPQRALQSNLNLWSNLAAMIVSLPLAGYESPDPRSWPRMAARIFQDLNPWTRNVALTQINLKQFRDASRPRSACYQALVSSDLTLRRVNGGGLLGSPYLQRGDWTGGYRLDLHKYTFEPILETLGLEPALETTVDGQTVSTLYPTMPYWLDVDLVYGPGRVLWEEAKTRDDGKLVLPRFNTAAGGANQEIIGPFDFTDLIARILPIEADRARLKAFCDDYLPEDAPYSIEPAWNLVFLALTSQSGVVSETDNVGSWGNRLVELDVPVIWRNDRGEEGLAFIPAYRFTDRSTAAVAAREVNGFPALYARLTSPPDPWMGHEVRQLYSAFLEVELDILPAVGEGQQTSPRRVLTVGTSDQLPWTRPESPRTPKDEDEDRENWLAGAAPPKSRDHVPRGPLFPFDYLTFKQFRDSEKPQEACYQSLVWIPTRPHRLVAEDDHSAADEGRCGSLANENLLVSITDYPALPIVQTLGLLPKDTRIDGGELFYEFEPVCPLWFQGRYEQDLGVDLIFRSTSGPWQEGELKPGVPRKLPGAVARIFRETNRRFFPWFIETLLEVVEKMNPREVDRLIEVLTTEPDGPDAGDPLKAIHAWEQALSDPESPFPERHEWFFERLRELTELLTDAASS